MKKITTLLLLLFSVAVLAQGKDRFEKGGGSKESPETTREAEQDAPREKSFSESDFWDRLVFGGNASIAFGNTTAIFVSPSVGYRATERYTVGTGFIYQYLSLSAVDQNGNLIRGYVKTSTYGPLLFNYFNITELLYVGAQFEYLNHDAPIVDPLTGNWFGDTERIWSPVLFIEAGYTQRIGNRGAVRLGLRYNVLDQGIRSPYASPWFPVLGFFF